MPIYEYDNIDVETPDVVSDEVLHVYIPKATYDSPGIAKFNSKYFNVDNGEVKIKDIYVDLDKANVVQITGDSTTDVMSQKASTDSFAQKDEVNALKEDLDSKASTEYVDNAVASASDRVPMFVSSVAEMTDQSNVYVLTSGGASYTNLYNASEATDGQRLNSSGTTSAATGAVTTGFIPFTKGDTIRIKGIDFSNTATGKVSVYYNGKTFLANITPASQAELFGMEILSDGTLVCNELGNSGSISGYSGLDYFRVSGDGASTDDIIITVNEEITEGGASGYIYAYDTKTQSFVNTGLAYAPASNQTQVNQNTRDIANHETRITTLENTADTADASEIPEYWNEAVSSAVEKMKAIYKTAGSNATGFVFCSDMHCEPNDSNKAYIQNIGKLASKVMRECSIPFFCSAGDNTTQSSGYSISDMEANMVKVREIFKYIPDERVILTVGNHDGATGQKTVDGTLTHYRYQLTEAERYNVYFRKYATSIERHYGNGGTYFYVDDNPNKLRYILLNTHWTIWAGDSDGFTTDIQNSYFHNSIFGQEQLSWLANEALDMPSGYNAVIIQHTSSDGADERYIQDRAVFNAVVNGFNNKTTVNSTYTGTYDWQSSMVTKDFADTNGEVIAVFVGHKHADTINTTVLSCPIISITTCGAYDDIRDTNPPTRTAGTATETAIDIVTIDKSERKIYMTRLGAGSDREISY